jgi:hypothetical protein
MEDSEGKEVVKWGALTVHQRIAAANPLSTGGAAGGGGPRGGLERYPERELPKIAQAAYPPPPHPPISRAKARPRAGPGCSYPRHAAECVCGAQIQ